MACSLFLFLSKMRALTREIRREVSSIKAWVSRREIISVGRLAVLSG